MLLAIVNQEWFLDGRELFSEFNAPLVVRGNIADSHESALSLGLGFLELDLCKKPGVFLFPVNPCDQKIDVGKILGEFGLVLVGVLVVMRLLKSFRSVDRPDDVLAVEN